MSLWILLLVLVFLAVGLGCYKAVQHLNKRRRPAASASMRQAKRRKAKRHAAQRRQAKYFKAKRRKTKQRRYEMAKRQAKHR